MNQFVIKDNINIVAFNETSMVGKHLLFFIHFLILSHFASAQNDPPCHYIPLEFNEVNPIWAYLCIDSTFIGHIDTSESSGEYIQYYYDGMDQLLFDGGSFIHKDFLYSITRVFYDDDLAGYYIEKIDLTTGESLWKIRTDLRHVENREKAMDFEIIGDEFIMYGVRTFWDEKDLKLLSLETGLIPTYLFIRKYNLETGELLYHYTPSNSDTLAKTLNSNLLTHYLFKLEDNNFEYFTLDVNKNFGFFVTKLFIDSLGHQNSNLDTVITGCYNDLNYHETYFKRTQQFIKDEKDNYYFLQQFLPTDTSDLVRQSKISKYNSHFDEIASWDFSQLGQENYSSFSIIDIKDDQIILKGCAQLNPNLFCEIKYIILDSELNYVNSFLAAFDDSFLDFITYRAEDIIEENHIIAIDRFFNENGHSQLEVFVSNADHQMDSVRFLTIKEPNWVAEVEKLFILENGDLLAKFTHSCYRDSRKNSWHPEWFRFKAEDFDLTTSIFEPVFNTNKIQIYPNPASHIMKLKLQNPVTAKAMIYNTLGRKIKSISIENQSEVIVDLHDLESGSYFIKIISDNQLSLQGKFIKM